MEKIKIKLEKLEERPDAEYPGSIKIGFQKIGEITKLPEIGECFWVGSSFRTSTVEEIIDKNTFKTVNSVYRFTELGK